MAGDQVDQVLASVGYGRWQVAIIVLCLAVHAIIPVHQNGATILNAPVDFHCSPLHANHSSTPTYDSICLDLPPPTPPPGLPGASVGGWMGPQQHVTGLASCPVVEYNNTVFANTVVTEWHLICERSWWRPLYPIMFPLGSLVGSVLTGYLSDKLGRKRTIRLGALLMVPSSLGVVLVAWFPAMLALKALSAVALIMMFYPSYSLAAETAPPQHRGATLLLLAMAYFVAFLGMGALGYLVTAWRGLWIIWNAPLMLVLPLLMLVDESPRWLLQKGRCAEAVDILEKAARVNDATLTQETVDDLNTLQLASKIQEKEGAVGGAGVEEVEEVEEGGCCQGGWRYVAAPGMRTVLLVTPLLWFFQRVVYMGIILSANNFTGNSPFGYVMLSGTMGCVALVLVTPLMTRLGRRTLVGAALLSSTAFLLAELAVPAELWQVKFFLVMAAFCVAVAAFQVNYAYAAELMPTVFRTRGFTLVNLVGCLGEAAVPLVTDIAAQYAWWAGGACFGLAGVLGSLLVLPLPETKDTPLVETLQDVEDRAFRSKHRRQKSRDNLAKQGDCKRKTEEPTGKAV